MTGNDTNTKGNTMTATSTDSMSIEKSGKWTSFCGPSYRIAVDGVHAGSIIGGYCHTGGKCMRKGRKTRLYTVIVNGKAVGSAFSLKSAERIARKECAIK